MRIEDKAEQQLVVIKNELVALFSDYCRRVPEDGLRALMDEFSKHRLDLVFTVKVSATETCFFCGYAVSGSEPQEMQALFTVYSSPINQQMSNKVH